MSTDKKKPKATPSRSGKKTTQKRTSSIAAKKKSVSASPNRKRSTSAVKRQTSKKTTRSKPRKNIFKIITALMTVAVIALVAGIVLAYTLPQTETKLPADPNDDLSGIIEDLPHVPSEGGIPIEGEENGETGGEKTDPENPVKPVDPDPVDPDPVNPDPVDPDPVNPDPVNPDPVNPDPVNPDPVNPDPVDPDPVDPDPVDPDPVDPDPVDPEKTEYSITFYLDNANGNWSLYKKIYFDESDSSMTLSAEQMPKDPVREGYTFLGWFNGDGSKISSGIPYNKGELIAYAQWEKIEKEPEEPKEEEEEEDKNESNTGISGVTKPENSDTILESNPDERLQVFDEKSISWTTASFDCVVSPELGYKVLLVFDDGLVRRLAESSGITVTKADYHNGGQFAIVFRLNTQWTGVALDSANVTFSESVSYGEANVEYSQEFDGERYEEVRIILTISSDFWYDENAAAIISVHTKYTFGVNVTVNGGPESALSPVRIVGGTSDKKLVLYVHSNSEYFINHIFMFYSGNNSGISPFAIGGIGTGTTGNSTPTATYYFEGERPYGGYYTIDYIGAEPVNVEIELIPYDASLLPTETTEQESIEEVAAVEYYLGKDWEDPDLEPLDPENFATSWIIVKSEENRILTIEFTLDKNSEYKIVGFECDIGEWIFFPDGASITVANWEGELPTITVFLQIKGEE